MPLLRFADHCPVLMQAMRLRMPSATSLSKPSFRPIPQLALCIDSPRQYVQQWYCKSTCRYFFEYPTGWKTDVINKTQKGTQVSP